MNLSKLEKMQLKNEVKVADEKNRCNDKRDGKSIKANMRNRIKEK